MPAWLQRDWCSSFVLALGHFVWQGTLIAVVLAIALRATKAVSVRYWLSLAALLVMAVSPVVTLGWLLRPMSHVVTLDAPPIVREEPAPSPPIIPAAPFEETSDVGQVSNLPVNPPVAPLDFNTTATILPIPTDERSWWQKFAPQLTTTYLCGVSLMLLRLVFGLWGGRRLRRRVHLIDDPSLLAAMRRQATALGLKLLPVLAYCERVTVPTVVGVLKPMILLPLTLTSGLSPEQIESVLAHELAHLRRYDHLVNLLQRVIESLLFFHPAMWWVSHRIRDEREHCCDDLVVACGAMPLDYAKSLLVVAELSRASQLCRSVAAVSLLATGNQKPSNLRQRIARLLGESATPSLRVSPRALLLAIGIPLVALIVTIQSGAGRDRVARPESSKGVADAEDSHALRKASERATQSGSPDPTLDSTAGLPNSDDDTNEPNNANGDLRSNPASGSGDTRRAQVDAIADRFISTVRRKAKFLDDEQLAALRNELRDYLLERVTRPVSEERQKEVLRAVELFVVDVHRQWFERPTRFMLGFETLKWHLWTALDRDELTPEQLALRESQRKWFREFARTLPDPSGGKIGTWLHQDGSKSEMTTIDFKLKELEDMLTDPLNPYFAWPFTEDEFRTIQMGVRDQKWIVGKFNLNGASNAVFHPVAEQQRRRVLKRWPIKNGGAVFDGFGKNQFRWDSELAKRPLSALKKPRAGRGSPDPALDPTAGLPNSDEETNPPNNANGDLRSNPEAGSGDPRPAQGDAVITAAELEKLIQLKGRELFFGRMELVQEFEMLWATKDQKVEKVTSKGTARWLKNTRLTRIDSERMVPGTGTIELHPESWTTGFDGVRSYSWNRAGKLISYGAMRPGAIEYSPNLFFWGRSEISFPQPMFGPNPKITRETRDGREEFDVIQDVPKAKLSIRYVGIVPDRSYLPTRVETRVNDRLESLTEFQDFFQPNPGVWAPKTIVWTAWSADNDANGKPIVAMSSKMTVIKLELGDNAKLQDDEFQLKLPDDVKEVDAATANAAGSGDPRLAQEVFKTLECDIVDAVTGKPIAETKVSHRSYRFIKPKSGDVPEKQIELTTVGMNNLSRVLLFVPDEIMRRADRDELLLEWRGGNDPVFENYESPERIPLKQLLSDDPKSGRDSFRTIKLTPKKQVGLQTLRKPALLLPDHWIVQAVGFDNDGKELVTASNQSFITIRRWDVVGMKLISEIKLQADKHGRAVRSGTLKFSGDRRRVVAATDEYVGIWDATTGKLLKQLPFLTKEGIYSCAIDMLDATPDLSVIVGHRALPGRLTLVFDAHVIVWDGLSGNVLQTVIDKGATDLKAIDLSTDGKQLVTTNGGGAKVWETSTGKLLRSLPNDNKGRKHSDPEVTGQFNDHVWSVQLSPDGKQLAVGDILGVRLWDVASGKLVQQLEGPYRYSSGSNRNLVFSKDGQQLARLGTQEKAEGDKHRYVVPIWSTQTGQKRFELHTESNDAVFSDDGQRLAVVFSDMQQALSVWSLSGDAANVEQTAGPGPHSRQDRVEENGHYVGKTAAEFIDKFQPTWGDTQLGLQYGIALTKPQRQFRSGERVPLVVFVRNASDQPIKFDTAPDFFGNTPKVLNAKGEPIAFENIPLLGHIPHYHEKLAPGEALGPFYLNFGLGENPRPGQQNWHPYFKTPVTGQYKLTHSVSINVTGQKDGDPSKRDDIATGTIEFEIVDGVQARAGRGSPDPALDPTAGLPNSDKDTKPANNTNGDLRSNPAAGSGDPRPALPKNKEAQALLKLWSTRARANGKIPGALIGQLAESVTTFTKYNPTWETTPQLLKMLPRLEVTHDWSGQDVVTLLDELAALQATPIGMLLDNEFERTIQTGTPLPKELADTPWGETLPNGLRMAWLLEPRVTEHRLGTALKSRVLIHNAGKDSVVFRTRTWHQVGHKARDANGEEINVESTHWTTRGRLVPFRLAPGEFIEVNAPGIGVGANKNHEDWQYTKIRVGSWIDTTADQKVVLLTNSVPLSDWNEEPPASGEPRWWRQFLETRLSQDLPLPDDAEERTRLLDRAVRELFGTAPTAEETAAFVADREPTELKEVLARRETVIGALAKRLANRAGLTPFSGSLQSRSTIFRVLPPDPDVAKKPRSASNPGQYSLDGNATLVVTRRSIGERIVNEAHLAFAPTDATKPAPREIKLPDGYDTWAAAWQRGGTVLWVLQKGTVRSYDFTNPAQVKEAQLVESDFNKVPPPILEALRAALDVPSATK